MATPAILPTSAALARDRQRIRTLQWSIVGVFTVVGVLTLVLPIGRTEFRSQWLHVPYILALAGGAANSAWGTWTRFRMDGTSRAWLLAAAFAVLALLYAPHAVYGAQESDPAGFFYGPASRLAFGVILIIAMSPMPVPRFVRRPQASFLLLVLLFVGVVDLFLHADWVIALLEPDPRRSNQYLETAAFVAQSIAVLQFVYRWWRTKRRIMITWIAGVGAMAIGSALMIPAEGWQLRWWWGHLGLLAATVIFVLGTDRQMARAIHEHELLLVYQPKVWLRTGELAGVEALLRWQHPDHGLVPAGDFIPKAEETDLITPFTMWAIRESIGQHRKWLDEGLKVPVAVNVAVRLLRDTRLIELIKAELTGHDLEFDAISLELTESQSLETETAATEMLAALAAAGLSIAVDDFGTGYSSLSYIRNLPVKEVKLDQSFVRKMESSDQDFMIVKSTIELAQGLGHKVVAEGIETEEVRNLLTALGCDIGQGYYWSRPLPAAELARWAREYQSRSKAGGTWAQHPPAAADGPDAAPPDPVAEPPPASAELERG